jgi:hypothetical protein
MRSFYIILLTVLLFSTGCYKREIEDILPPVLSAVEDLQYTFYADNDSVNISWRNPNVGDDISSIIRHNDGVMVLPGEQTSINYGIIKTNVEYAFTVKIRDTKGNYSLGQTVRFLRDGAMNVTNIRFVQDEDSVFVSWSLPVGEPLSKINVAWETEDYSDSQELSGATSNLKIVGLPLGNYSFSFVTTNENNLTSHTQYEQFRVGPTKIGFLSIYSDINSMTDDDEIAAAEWFNANISNSEWITFQQILDNTVDLNEFRVIWWHRDELGGSNLPAITKDPTVINAVNDFYKSGGNLLLSIHATMYLETLGRIPEGFSEGKAIGDGAGGENPDVWSISTNLRSYDYSNHPIYQGLEINNTANNGKEIPMIGPGWKEDHNSCWIGVPAAHGFGNADDAFIPFLENNFGVKMLGAWGHVRDYFMVGIGEMLPHGEYQGTAITIGLGAYEWNQNNTTNPFQHNIEGLTLNALEYLKTR